MAKIITTIEKDGILYECEIVEKINTKKWYEFYKIDTYTISVKYKFIRAVNPRLKISLEC